MKKLLLFFFAISPLFLFSYQEDTLSYSYEDRRADLRRDALRRENLRYDLRKYYQKQDNTRWDIKREQTEEDRLRDQQLKEELEREPALRS